MSTLKNRIRRTVEYLPGICLMIIPLPLFLRAAQWLLRVRLQRGEPVAALKAALNLDNAVYGICGQLAVAYGNGNHAKHRLTGYIEYFSSRAAGLGGPFLDVGCGNGVISNEIAARSQDRVVGIDISPLRIETANRRYKRSNLEFILGDATTIQLPMPFRTVVLSNVLEHISGRRDFLQKLVRVAKPQHILIRVPNFERDWRVPLKKELGVEWRLDLTHEVEHTWPEFVQEIEAAGLEIVSHEMRWGEIWAVTRPAQGGHVPEAAH